jgi:hypothetical protein
VGTVTGIGVAALVAVSISNPIGIAIVLILEFVKWVSVNLC